ncbi:hypothetical protein KO481_15710 [Nocardia sp. NEAU-G5]|uniref:Uncharacterized protein n=1 Tax=Nocardia albiluteola TaxID=2842303 RepID=A0ABS6AY69_9NOCA|nr:hypothetical protein [Nocardia albiluteola]MBU3062964.1 hypothetical protein [Nocardia albiluteola]
MTSGSDRFTMLPFTIVRMSDDRTGMGVHRPIDAELRLIAAGRGTPWRGAEATEE